MLVVAVVFLFATACLAELCGYFSFEVFAVIYFSWFFLVMFVPVFSGSATSGCGRLSRCLSSKSARAPYTLVAEGLRKGWMELDWMDGMFVWFLHTYYKHY